MEKRGREKTVSEKEEERKKLEAKIYRERSEGERRKK